MSQDAQSPLVYLKRELKFTSKEWLGLVKEDRSKLILWAKEEMEVLGLPIK